MKKNAIPNNFINLYTFLFILLSYKVKYYEIKKLFVIFMNTNYKLNRFIINHKKYLFNLFIQQILSLIDFYIINDLLDF